jgi:GT2 family glycosyltransferase
LACDISIVLFRPSKHDITPTFESLRASRTDFRKLRILVSGTNAEMRHVSELLNELDLSSQSVVIHRLDNLGFASGHNLILRAAFKEGADSVLVLNPDTFINEGALPRLLASVSLDARLALYGPSLKRIDTDDVDGGIRADTMGIKWTWSGRHVDIAQGEPWVVHPGDVVEASGVSGACLLVLRAAYTRVVDTSGWFFDDLFLAYREDAELGIRAHRFGVDSRIVHIEGFGHERSVRGAARGKEIPDLLGVRNRFLILFRLRGDRPGFAPAAILRDVIVILASATVERRSWSGVRSAFAIRRFATYSRARLDRARG